MSTSRSAMALSIVRRTALATAGAVGFSWALNYVLLLSDSVTDFARSAITATILPLVLVAPVVAYALWQHEKIRFILKDKAMAATRDPATGHFDQRIMAVAVEERRKSVSTTGPARGAFLLLEIGELKKINARFGPEWTASALALVAQTIRKNVRAGDIVGRLETGEFGIFLPGASERDAAVVGQRLINAISSAYFAPEGIERVVSTHVAGVVFEHELEFEEMVRHAAQRLAALPDEEQQSTIPVEIIPPLT